MDSDAEQLATSSDKTYSSMPAKVKCEPVVKEEPEWGLCETDARADLYEDHEIKGDLAFGPEIVQEQDIARSMQNVLVKQENYPCKLEPPGEIKIELKCVYTSPWDAPRSTSLEQQFKLRSCCVRLERIPQGDLLTTNTGPMTLDCDLKHRHVNPQATAGHVSQQTHSSHCKPSMPLMTKKPQCYICHKPFTKQSDLTRHIRIHTGEKPYSCDICHKRFADQSRLARHIRTHKGKEQHCCKVCHKQFVQKSGLDKHVLTHMGEKPHMCNTCHKPFAKQSDLVRHIRMHTGEKPYICDVCHKLFTDHSGLTRHKRVHSGVKLHSCSLCDKRFTQKAHLTRHILIHKGERKYTCDMCNRRFTQKQTLISHLRIHTGEKPYVCHICQKRFVVRSPLTKHLKSHMDDKPFSMHTGLQQTTDTTHKEVYNDSSPLTDHKILGL